MGNVTVFEATLFDYNGVLVDDEEIHFEAFAEVLRGQDVEVSREAYWKEYLGYDDVGGFEAMLRDAGRSVSRKEIDELVEAKKPVYLRLAGSDLSTFPDAAKVFAARAAAGPVVLVSGALRDEIELGLDVLGVRDLVLGIVAAEDTAQSKPDPDGYRQGIAMLNQASSRDVREGTLVIEDSVSGIEAAKSAGLYCAAVAHSYDASALTAAGADFVTDKLGELTEEKLQDLYQQRCTRS